MEKKPHVVPIFLKWFVGQVWVHHPSPIIQPSSSSYRPAPLSNIRLVDSTYLHLYIHLLCKFLFSDVICPLRCGPKNFGGVHLVVHVGRLLLHLLSCWLQSKSAALAGSCHCQKHEVLGCSYFIATLQDLASLAKAFPTLASTFTIGVIITNDYKQSWCWWQ